MTDCNGHVQDNRETQETRFRKLLNKEAYVNNSLWCIYISSHQSKEVNAVETDPDNVLTCCPSGRIKENDSSEHPEDFNHTHSPDCRVLTFLFQSTTRRTVSPLNNSYPQRLLCEECDLWFWQVNSKRTEFYFLPELKSSSLFFNLLPSISYKRLNYWVVFLSMGIPFF